MVIFFHMTHFQLTDTEFQLIGYLLPHILFNLLEFFTVNFIVKFWIFFYLQLWHLIMFFPRIFMIIAKIWNFIAKFWYFFHLHLWHLIMFFPEYLWLFQVVEMLDQVWSKAAYICHHSGDWICIPVLCFLLIDHLLVRKNTSCTRKKLSFFFFKSLWWKFS